MRAAVVRRTSGPFEIEDLRDPEPKAGEVLLRVAACGVCHTDLHVYDGSVPFPMPCVLGHEVSGVVEAVGDGVDGVKTGQRAVAAFIMPCGTCSLCTAGREELCERFFAHNRLRGTLYDGETRLFDRDGRPISMYSMGGLSELAVVPHLAVSPLPDELPLNESAILGCALLTAYGAAHHVGGVGRGATVAVVGSGGVGVNILQVARALGAVQAIAVDLAADKLEVASAMGATDVVNASETGAVERVLELTDGRGVDVAFEAIGHPATFRQATEMVADGGRAVMVGIAPVGRTAEVEITRLVRRKLQVLGSFGGRPRSDLAALTKLVVEGKLAFEPAITRRFSLEQAGEAYRLLAEGRISARALVVMDGA
jgi:succinate semialdehyde reductase (NADPH)